jgi:hypothetical protein
MIKHIVLLKWKDGVSSEQVDLVTSSFQNLKDQIPEIASYSFGKDASIYRGNADYALIAEFETEANFKAYVVHPKHQELLREITGPILESFQSVQFIDQS